MNTERLKTGKMVCKTNSIIKAFLFIISFLFVIFISNCQNLGSKVILYPHVDKESYRKNVHNEVIIDYYQWLRDIDWPNVQSYKILNHLESENKCTESYFSHYKKQKQTLTEEIKSKIIEEDNNYPVKHDNYYYYRKFVKGGNNFLICRKEGSLKNKEEIVLDINALSINFPNFRMGSFFHSPDHSMFAYSSDLKGQERYSISVKNLKNGITNNDVVTHTSGNIIWSSNNKGFFYTKLDRNIRSTEVFYHELSKDKSKDILVYKENDKTFIVNVKKTSDHNYLVINSYSNSENEIRILDIKKHTSFKPKLLLSRKKGQLYYIDHGHGAFYIKTNDKGKNFRLVKCKSDDFKDNSSLIEIIPHNDKQYLENFSLSKDYLVVNLKANATNQIIVFNKKDISKEIKFAEEAYHAYGYFPSYDSEFARINYESFITPPSVLEYNFKKNKLYSCKEKKISGGYDKSNYQSEKIYIKADDGVEVPISLFYRKDKFQKDGTNPLLLYGYGSYGIAKPPYFDSSVFSLVDRGFVYAIAHVRGGSELGFEWYESAKLLNKKRTFLDYINCADALVKQKYVNGKKLVGYGASAGGMLIGYVINERPELLKIAVTDVPSVDVLNFMLDETLPTTPFHFKELGDPKKKQYYDYIKSYSPYDNIKRQRYPAVYATAGLFDPRVAYWQSAKWVAKLREYNQGNEPILLYTDMSAGHFGNNGRYNNLRKKAMMYTFILSNLEIIN